MNDFLGLFYAIGFFSEQIFYILAFILFLGNKIVFWTYYVGIVINLLVKYAIRSVLNQPRPSHPVKFLESEDFSKSGKLKSGMPSGHSQLSFFSLFYILLSVQGNIIIKVFSAFVAIATVIERYTFKNHTLIQLFTGAVIGILIAYLTVFVRQKYVGH